MTSVGINKKVYGVGVNDADYFVQYKTKEGNKLSCPFYKKWSDMLRRCYSASFQEKHVSYIGCSVCEDWLTFSKFKAWMEKQDWEGKQLDKDILFAGNKIYSPETCVFVSQEFNSFLTDSNKSRGEYPLGVSYHSKNKKFVAFCKVSNKNVYLGSYETPEEAHEAWKAKKNEIALIFCEELKDVKAKQAFLERIRQTV